MLYKKNGKKNFAKIRREILKGSIILKKGDPLNFVSIQISLFELMGLNPSESRPPNIQAKILPCV